MSDQLQCWSGIVRSFLKNDYAHWYGSHIALLKYTCMGVPDLEGAHNFMTLFVKCSFYIYVKTKQNRNFL